MGKLSHIVKAIEVAKKRKLEAYHGTPHEVDRFSMDKIGTGEGAQAYGHGLYFAENLDVAGEYRKQLAHPPASSDVARDIKIEMDSYGAANMADRIESGKYDSWFKNTDEKNNVLNWMKGEKGNLYKVELDIDPNTEMLDWDKPLSGQPESVRNNFKKAFSVQDDNILNDISFDNFIENEGISQAQASKILNSSGIKGIKYSDQMSRGTGKGTSNFVVFDDSLISIAEKNGIPFEQVTNLAKQKGVTNQQALAMMVGGSTGAALMGNQEAEAGVIGVGNTVGQMAGAGTVGAAGLGLQAFIEKRKQRANSLVNRTIEKAQYYGEPAAALATGIGAGLFGDAVGGIAGLASLPFVGHERAAQITQGIQDSIPSYIPESEAGMQGLTDLVDTATEEVGALYKDAVDYWGIDPIANFEQSAEALHEKGLNVPAAILKGAPHIL
jgi:hypothetical protein